ncbi:sensory rhodopsin transducer [Neobacillus notoginsengisoli]|uniref:sensory rhodopsin transducer n=1 Tax=Neobacillus notoginsengisoli TaxID=1578198 RepID=UPI001313FCE1|nr:sensory rhodopsin transducer [Neobacillus notoginsengisoli]
MNGKKLWYFPDCDLPPAGDSQLKGHESIIVLNDSDFDATLNMTLFFTDQDPVRVNNLIVEKQRVRCIRMDNKTELHGFEVPLEIQYALKVESDQNVIIQYGRLDSRQTNLAYYTTLGY